MANAETSLAAPSRSSSLTSRAPRSSCASSAEDTGTFEPSTAALIEDACSAHEGHLIDTQGDAHFAAFDRAADAVATAVDAQRKLAVVEWPEGTQLRVRMGLHTAEPFLHTSGYLGLGLHRAARICAAAHGGQILVSNATAGIVEDLESVEFDLRDLGEFRLKDIARPQRLFELSVRGLEREFAAPMTRRRERA